MKGRHSHVLVDRGVSWEMALQLYDQYLIDHQSQASTCSQLGHVSGSGFYRSKKEQYHCHLYVLALLKENSTHLFNITRPNTGRSRFEETKSDFLNKYIQVSPEKAEQGWKSQYEKTKSHCIHGTHCKNQLTCVIGSRLTHIHLLSGGILPLLALLESTLARHSHSMALNKEARSLKVVRVKLDDGRRVIGIRYPLPLISEIASLLSVLKHGKKEDHFKASPVVIPTSAQDIVLEQQSPLNKKYMTKALTPPVSLKNYFTVKPKCSDQESKTEVESDKNEGLSIETKHSKMKATVQRKLIDTIGAIPSPTSSKCKIDKEAKGQSSVDKEWAPRSRKRKINAEPSRNTYSLTKMFKQTDSLHVTKCPVCGLEIEDSSNSAVNLHLDSCLAKSISQS